MNYGDGSQLEKNNDGQAHHIYSAVGNFTVSIKVSDALGANSTASTQVNIVNRPPTIAAVKCDTYNFEIFCYADHAFDPDGGPLSYEVNYGDGSQLEKNNDGQAHHIYSSDGNFTVSIKVTDLLGANSSASTQVSIVNRPPTIAAVKCDTYGFEIFCYADQANDPDGGSLSYEVNYGDGSQLEKNTDGQAHHIYNSIGNFNVSIKVTDLLGANNSASTQVNIVNRDPVVGAVKCDVYNLEVYCYPQNTYDPDNQPLTYEFNFGDGNVDTNTVGLGYNFYSTPGVFNVTMKVTDALGASTSASTQVNIVNRVPVVGALHCDIYGLEIYCYPENTYDPDNGALSFEYNYGDGKVESTGNNLQGHHIFSAAGDYTVSVKVTDPLGGTATTSGLVHLVNLPPVAFISCDVNNLFVACNSAGSYDPEQHPLQFKFDYGDGFVDTNNYGFTNHAYTQAGLNTVTLTITDNAGNVSTATTQVMPLRAPNILPVAMFHCDTPNPLTVNCFDDGSYDPDGSIIIRKIFYDDDKSDFLTPGQPTIHKFSSAAPHGIVLLVTDNDGGQFSILKIISVRRNNPPIASMVCNSYAPQKISCYSTSTDPDQGDYVSTFDWDFGDGTTQSGLQGYFSDHLYSTAGTYTVKLTAHDQYGGATTVSQDVVTIENQAPIANINCFVTVGTTYQCNANSYDPDGQIVNQVWNVGGVTLSGNSIVYNFTNGGDYPITLTMTDDLGKTATATTSVHIDLPIASFTCNIGEPLNVSCDGSNSSDQNGGRIVSYRFEYDGKDFSLGVSGQYVFDSFGSHQIKLIIQNQKGEIGTKIVNYNFEKIYLQPKVAFEANINLNKVVQFDASKSLYQNREVTLYEWSFGDGSSISSTNPIVSKSFNSFGSYTVSLTITDNKGVKDTLSREVAVYDPEVQDPGDNGKTSYLGIDSDNDGVRDDVQLIINNIASTDSNLKIALRALVKNYDVELRKVTNRDDITIEVLKNNQITNCLSSMNLGENGDQIIINTIDYSFFNTEERARAYYLIESLSSHVNLPEATLGEDLSPYCQGL